MSTYDNIKAQYDKLFAQHRLELLLHNDPFSAYRLVRPEGGRINSVMIMFTPEGVVIAGDHAPCRHGVISDFGYDRKWFLSLNGPGYLATKFGLERKFQTELAEEFLNERIKELQDAGASAESLEPWQDLLEQVQLDMDHSSFQRALTELKEDETWNIAIGYDPRDMANLAAIQQRFAACFQEMDQVKPAVEA